LIGQIFAEQGNRAEALKEFEQALKLIHTHERPRRSQGFARRAAGNSESKETSGVAAVTPWKPNDSYENGPFSKCSVLVPVLLVAATLLTSVPNGVGAESRRRSFTALLWPGRPISPRWIRRIVFHTGERSDARAAHPYRAALEASRGRLQELDANCSLPARAGDAVLAEHLDELQVREKATAVAQLEARRPCCAPARWRPFVPR